jgi:uncharacterized protein (DUF305 family)
METKPLLFGLVGFFLGGLLVSVAATSFDKPTIEYASDMPMNQMTGSLKSKQGDEFDKAFITAMIAHHEDAVEMARLSASSAKHTEIKKLSNDIIAAQEKEIRSMRRWQMDWGYSDPLDQSQMNH